MKTGLLLAALTALFLLIGDVAGGRNGMVMAFGLAVLMNFGAYWFSDKIVLAMYRAQPIQESDSTRLFSIVRRAATSAHLPMPKVYVIPTETPNAFATGRNPQHAAVAATEGILKVLNDDELEGVMAHELTHVKNRDTLISSVVATIAGAISMLANMAMWAGIFGGGRDRNRGNGIGLLVMAIVAPLAAVLIQTAISRAREFMADEGGAKISRKPLALAGALRKLQNANLRVPMQANPSTAHLFIVNPLSGGSMLSLFSTHPPVEQRIARLQEMATRI